MPLPFLDPKKIAMSVVATKMKKSGGVQVKPEVEAPDSDMDPGLKAAAEDILKAVQDKSVMDLAKAIKAAIEVCGAAEEPTEDMGE